MLLSTWEVLSAWKYKCCAIAILLSIRSPIITHVRFICVSLKKKKKKNKTVYFWKWGFMEWYKLWLCADAGNKTFWETENIVSIFEVCKKHQSGIKTILSLLPQSFPLSLHLAFAKSFGDEGSHSDGFPGHARRSSRCHVKNLFVFN